MQLLNRFLNRTDFISYEDFKENFKLNIPEKFNYARDVVDFIACESPDKLALLYCNDEGEEKRYSFTDISILSKKAAAYFKAIGIKQGDRVILMLRRRAEYWICAVALHRLGAVVVPAFIQFPQKDIAYRVNTAKAAAIIYIDDAFVKEQIKGLEEKCPTLCHKIIVGAHTKDCDGAHDFSCEYEAFAPLEEVENQDNEAEFIAYFTSGTTNQPKMALHNKTYPIGHIVTARFMQNVQNGGLHLTMADSGWAKFGWGNIYGQWICETAILAYDPVRFDAKNLITIAERCKPTSLCVPPTMYRFILKSGLKRRHFESIKWYSTAGEPLSPEVNKEFERITGHSIHEGFGQSEGTPITCTYEWLTVRPGSMGKPSALYDVTIVNKQGERCNVGDVGEIVIRVDPKRECMVGLITGYVNEKGFEKGYDTIYHTGDMAYEDEDGYYWFVGRNDDMIKCSGYRIGPFEIESILNTHEAVKESAIIGRPDPVRGQVVCAVVSLYDKFVPSEELTRELQAHVKCNTAPYKYPRIIEYCAELPKTSSGKIIRKAL